MGSGGVQGGGSLATSSRPVPASAMLREDDEFEQAPPEMSCDPQLSAQNVERSGEDVEVDDEEEEMQTRLIRQMIPPMQASSAVASSSGGAAVAASDPLHGMPSHVAQAWERWTQPAEAFGSRVVAQAVQPPFSDAYISCDAAGGSTSSGRQAGSGRRGTPPPADDLLELRWRTAAGRALSGRRRSSQEIPEFPEHLSRAYLSAVLRDMGRFARGSADLRGLEQSAGQQRQPSASRAAEGDGHGSQELRFPRLHVLGDFAAGSGSNDVAR